MTRAISGPTCSGLLRRYARHFASSRTSQITLWSDLRQSDETYAELVTRLRLDYSARRKWERHTAEPDCSSWLTPATSDTNGPREPDGRRSGGLNTQAQGWPTPNVPNGGRTTNTSNRRDDGSKRQVMLEAVTRQWPTPTTGDSLRGPDTTARREGSPSLTGATRQWPTPMADDARQTGGKASRAQGRQAMLNLTARQWPTPAARDGKGATAEPIAPDGRNRLDQLDRAAEHWQTPKVARGAYTRDKGVPGQERDTLIGQAERWPTPKVSDWKGADPARDENRSGARHAGDGLATTAPQWPTPTATPYGSSQNGINGIGGANERPSANTPSLDRQTRSLCGRLDLASSTPGHECSSKCRRLSPLFVEWLMCWPIGWTDCASPATGLYRWLQRQRLHLFGSNYGTSND